MCVWGKKQRPLQDQAGRLSPCLSLLTKCVCVRACALAPGRLFMDGEEASNSLGQLRDPVLFVVSVSVYACVCVFIICRA